MRHTTITARDLECLEHMRNVGQLVGDLMQVQDCATVRRDPAQQLQLTSVIYLISGNAPADQRDVYGECQHHPA